ncbi:cysteine hydrolase [bacterium]|nr:cysteine hydrolase [bacterium]
MEQSNLILVIDMLKDFLEPGHPLFCGPDARKIIPCVLRLLAGHGGDPVFYICDSHAPDDPEFQMFPPHSVAGTPGADLIGELKAYPGVIIPKTTLSAFYLTDLEERLKDVRPGLVTVVGVCTDICVLYAVADLRVRGYKVVVPASCVASFDPKGHEWALQHMEKVLGATIKRERD